MRSPKSPSLIQRSFSGLTAGGIRLSTVTLVCTSFGSPNLSCCYVMNLVGIGLGVLCYIVSAFLAYVSSAALMEMSMVTGCQTYSEICTYALGPRAGPLLDMMLFVFGNGVFAMGLKLLTDYVPSLVGLLHAAPAWVADRRTTIFVSAALVFPLAVQKNIAALSEFTKFQLAAFVYTAFAIVLMAPGYLSENGGLWSRPVRFFTFDASFIEAFGMTIFAFNSHNNVVPVVGGLVRPTKARIVKLAWRVQLFQLCLYVPIGVIGYLTFLDNTPQDILTGYPSGSGLIVASRAVLSLAVIVGISLNVQPAVRSGLQVLDYLRGPSAGRQPWTSVGPLSPPPRRASPWASSESVKAPPEPQWPRLTTMLACTAAQVGVAVVGPEIADIITLVLSPVATTFMAALPAYLLGAIMPQTRENSARRALLYMCAAMSYLGVPYKVLQLAGVLPGRS